MSALTRIPAAQYLRMSTEHQQYSLDNQAEALQRYAEGYGFLIVKTYTDAGKSGLVLTRRSGLNQLLQDVVNGTREYGAILVYDVSRWGRFQDTDEAAHYEFLCKRAGIQVHYCAEPFANDGSLSSSILKALKRSMAAEYSRELGVKVYVGKKRLVQLGYRVGGEAGYGLRRMLLSQDGKRKQKLQHGERKSLITDRVILVPGPKKEVEWVRRIFRMRLRKSYFAIAQKLNSWGVPHLRGKPWTEDRVKAVLTNPKYAGRNVWGRTSAKLKSRSRAIPPEQWTVSPVTFEPLVDQQTFSRAQAVRIKRSSPPLSDEALLKKLRVLLAAGSKLSSSILEQSPGGSADTYRLRFGSLRRAFELVGYRLPPGQLKVSEQSRRRRRLQQMLIGQVHELFPNQNRVCFVKYRLAFILEDGAATVPISICLCFTTRREKLLRWMLRVPRADRNIPTLICLANLTADSFVAFYLMRGIEMGNQDSIKGGEDPLLQRGQRLDTLADLWSVAQITPQG